METVVAFSPHWISGLFALVLWWAGLYLLYRQLAHLGYLQFVLRAHLRRQGDVVVEPTAPWHEILEVAPTTTEWKTLRTAHNRLVRRFSKNSPLFRLVAKGQRQILDDAFTLAAQGVAKNIRRGVPALLPPKDEQAIPWRAILGVHGGVTEIQDIKTAFRKKAMRLHPDRADGMGAAMAELNAAFAAAERELIQPGKRKAKRA